MFHWLSVVAWIGIVLGGLAAIFGFTMHLSNDGVLWVYPLMYGGISSLISGILFGTIAEIAEKLFEIAAHLHPTEPKKRQPTAELAVEQN